MTTKTNRTADFHIRMTPEERDYLDAVAAACGFNRSELIRLITQLPCERIDEANVHAVYVDKHALMGIRREMRRFGTNLNQATHSLNAIALFLRRGRLHQEFLEEQAPYIKEQLDDVILSQKALAEKIDALVRDCHFVEDSRCQS